MSFFRGALARWKVLSSLAALHAVFVLGLVGSLTGAVAAHNGSAAFAGRDGGFAALRALLVSFEQRDGSHLCVVIEGCSEV